MNCKFCKSIKDKEDILIIWEDDKYLLFLDNHPVRVGHMLLIPKKHVDEIIDLKDEDYVEIMLLTKKVSLILKQYFKTPRAGIVIEGYGVGHAHIHIVPILHQGDLDPDNAKKVSLKELRGVQKEISECFINLNKLSNGFR